MVTDITRMLPVKCYTLSPAIEHCITYYATKNHDTFIAYLGSENILNRLELYSPTVLTINTHPKWLMEECVNTYFTD